jgi:WhiB family redox-sensing transcriptional regulator
MTWQDMAACRNMDTNLFYPPYGKDIPEVAKAICSGCPVKAQCRDFAIGNRDEHGIWGGMDSKERADYARGRR